MRNMKLYMRIQCIGCGLPVHMHRDKCGRAISCHTLFQRYLPVPTVVKAPSRIKKKIKAKRRKG